MSKMTSLSQDTEKQLAIQLKTLCFVNGRERNPQESAKILHKLGLEYKKRSPNKVSLIQSATLLNAAIVRNPDNVKIVVDDLRELCSLVLKEAGATNNDACLVSVSNDVKNDVEEMRRRANEALGKMKNIPTNVEGDELRELEVKKIADIENIQNRISDDYIEIMDKLKRRCSGIMGEPPFPCNFALVGMGSLARKEITPYSDFENVIVLDDVIKDKANYDEILEYFRWFAVIFQLVLINMGETLIASVAIPSLNDFSTPGGDWFFDAYTPSGICFDGMMPHACKSPLGRQEKTKNKPWKTELIRTVSEMAKYLESDEDLKNGYHLSDILTKTCFVSGGKLVYDAFYDSVLKKLDSNRKNILTFFKGLEKQIIEDKIKFDVIHNCVNMYSTSKFNMKRVVYRSTTIFLSALATFHGIDSTSCFDTINQLAERGLITNADEHKLNYAVAVACEVRLKIYMKKQRQNDLIDNNAMVEEERREVIRAVGEKSIIDYFAIARNVQTSISDLSPGKINKPMNMQLDKATTSGSVALICFCLTLYEMCIEFCESELENDSNLTEASRARYLSYIGTSFRHLNQLPKAIHYMLQSLELQRNLKDEESAGEVSNLLQQIACAKLSLDRSDEALQYYKEALIITRSMSADQTTDKPLSSCLHHIGQCLAKSGRYEEALVKYEEEFKILKRTSHDIKKDEDFADALYHAALCELAMGKQELSEKKLHRALDIAKLISVNETTDKFVENISLQIDRCTKSIDAEELKEYQEYLNQRCKVSDERTDVCRADCLNKIGKVLHKMRRFTDALRSFDEAVTIRKRISKDESKDREIADMLNAIGLTMIEAEKCEEAKQKFEEDLDILKRISEDESADKDIATATYNIGICMRMTNKPKDALDIFKKALQIRRKLTKDVSCDTNVADTLQQIGVCLSGSKRHKEALHYMEEEMNIRRRISVDECTDHKVATCLSYTASCLAETRNFQQALKAREEELQINRNLSKDECVDKDIYDCLGEIARCMIELRRYREALSKLREQMNMQTRIETHWSRTGLVQHRMSVCRMLAGTIGEPSVDYL